MNDLHLARKEGANRVFGFLGLFWGLEPFRRILRYPSTNPRIEKGDYWR